MQLLFALAAGVLVAAATASATLLGSTMLGDPPAAVQDSGGQAAAMAVVLGANVLNAVQMLQDTARAVASRQVGSWG